MARKKSKNSGNKRKPVKQIQEAATVKRKAEYADFTKNLDKGLQAELYVHTVEIKCYFGADPSDEIGLCEPDSTGKPEYGMLVFVALVVAAIIVSIGAIV